MDAEVLPSTILLEKNNVSIPSSNAVKEEKTQAKGST